MAVLKLNNTQEFNISAYSKNTIYDPITATTRSNGNFTIQSADSTVITSMMTSPITDIKIYTNDNLIYSLANIHAQIDSLSESLSGIEMVINVSLTFSTLDNE